MGLLRIWSYIFVYLFLICYVSALVNQSILHKIKSDKSSDCRSTESPVSSFTLSKVPQFEALCNVPPPNVELLKFLLENNVTPILCMGLYDVFQRFCQSATKIPMLKEKFPLTVEETNKLFDSFDTSNSFSSLNTFCSITVKNNTITQSASVDTELWWRELNDQIRSESTCLEMCRTNDKDKVNPLCSYIIWFNSLYLNLAKVYNEPNPRLKENDENQQSLSKLNLNKEALLESNQIWPSTIQNQSTLSSTALTGVSTFTTLQHSDQLAPRGEVPVLEANGTDKVQVVSIPSSSSQLTISSNYNVGEPNTSKVVPLKHSQKLGVNAKTETILTLEPALTIEKVDKIKVKEEHVKSVIENNTFNSKQLLDKHLKIEGGYSTPVVLTKPVHDTKVTPEKHTDGMDESDFTLEVTPDGLEMEQPSLADKDLQQPYTDEELENGDGDDIDFEPEGSVKLSQNKTIPNKSKAISATVDQGINDPDKAYGEEREILIEDHFIEAEDSHFFTYFLCMAVLTILAYLAFHNKKKLLALALEGKRTRSTRRRPNSSNYSKLDCSLEEAMSSGHTPASVTHVLY